MKWSLSYGTDLPIQVGNICPYIAKQKHLTLYRAKFFRGIINIYLHFVSFLHFDMTQVLEILPQIRQEPTYST